MMPELQFNYHEVSAEYTRLGFKYPKDEDFAEEQVDEALKNLADGNKYELVAKLVGTKFSGGTIALFGQLAQTLSAKVLFGYNSLEARVALPLDVQRHHALESLKQDADSGLRDQARESLRAKANRVDSPAPYPYGCGKPLGPHTQLSENSNNQN
jgi:hypothetical protein